MDYWIIFGIGLVSLGSFVVYMAFMFFLPEWVGITGKVAKDAIKSHVINETEEEQKIHQI